MKQSCMLCLYMRVFEKSALSIHGDHNIISLCHNISKHVPIVQPISYPLSAFTRRRMSSSRGERDDTKILIIFFFLKSARRYAARGRCSASSLGSNPPLGKKLDPPPACDDREILGPELVIIYSLVLATDLHAVTVVYNHSYYTMLNN